MVHATSCVYCGVADATTEDHVIAECFFASAPPESYIKVPACSGCNQGFSLDEQYVRTALLPEATFSNRTALRLLERLGGSFERGDRSRLRLLARLRNATERIEVTSGGGLFLGNAPAVRLEVERVNRVLRKIIQGLYFHEFGRRLHEDSILYVELKPSPVLLERPPLVWVPASERPRKTLGDVFCYRVHLMDVRDAVDCTAWLLGFYESILAAAITGKRDIDAS